MPKITVSFYLAKHFLKWTLVVILAMTALVLLIEFSEIMRKASSRPHIGLIVLWQMLILKTPTFLEQIFPFVILFSSLLTLWNLNRHQEILIMKVSGFSIWQLLAPLIIVVWTLGCLDMTILQPITAQMMKRYAHLDHQHFNQATENIVVAESGVWLQENINNIRRIYHVAYIDRLSKSAHHVNIFQYNHEKFDKRFQAEKLYFHDNFLMLRNVWHQALQRPPMYQKEVNLSTTLSLERLQDYKRDPSSISFWNLSATSQILKQSGLSGHKYDLHWHSLMARWIWLGVMVLLAASCSLRPIRTQGTGVLMGTGALGAFVLYFLRDVMYALGSSGVLSIVLAAWTPVFVSAVLSIAVLLHFEER